VGTGCQELSKDGIKNKLAILVVFVYNKKYRGAISIGVRFCMIIFLTPFLFRRSAMRLKKHETPRKQGRNTKSKKASARLRQLKKMTKRLIKKLKESVQDE